MQTALLTSCTNTGRLVKAAILNHQNQYSAAIALYNEIISKQPEASAYNNRGIAKSALGNKQGAIMDMSKASELLRQQYQIPDFLEKSGI